jgi:glutamate formiminotransferase/formiminotetrahydrofolate cyclodeaminase
VKIPGTLKAVKAMGVHLERFNIAQVSINLVDYEVTPPHVAFEEVRRQAITLGADVTGSEIVGLTPLQALLAAGRFYAARQNQTGAGDDALVELAIQHLGLSQLEQFVPSTKVIENQLS